MFVNGSILGVHRRPAQFAATLRTLRRRGGVGPYVSVFAQQDAVYLACDGGRVCRPLIVCDAGRPRVTSEHMQATSRKVPCCLTEGVLPLILLNQARRSSPRTAVSPALPATFAQRDETSRYVC